MDALHLFSSEQLCLHFPSSPFLLPPSPPVVGAGWGFAPLEAFHASNSLNYTQTHIQMSVMFWV